MKKAILALFNKSWKSGTVPALWKKATIIPIYKKGKDKKHPNSYKPISLLSCLGVIQETQKNRRLTSTTRTRNRECLPGKVRDCGSIIRPIQGF